MTHHPSISESGLGNWHDAPAAVGAALSASLARFPSGSAAYFAEKAQRAVADRADRSRGGGGYELIFTSSLASDCEDENHVTIALAALGGKEGSGSSGHLSGL